VARVFRALDVIVHSSTEPEPFGRTIVEGMSCARPVLVANAGGAAELFLHGANGLGYEVGNVAALCEHMKAVEASVELRRSLGVAGRDWAVEHFSRARLGPELLRAFGDP
jgi:glycosyltransferase involved in cell wall biosynthesis